MYCTVHKIKTAPKWAVCFYDNNGHRTDRQAEFFDREIDALNRAAEIMALEDYVSIPEKEDAVEVVRCKDCKHYSNGGGTVRGKCYCEDHDIAAYEGYRFYVKEDDFCSHGERRNDDN